MFMNNFALVGYNKRVFDVTDEKLKKNEVGKARYQ